MSLLVFISKYRRTVRRLPIPAETDPDPGRRTLRTELRDFLREPSQDELPVIPEDPPFEEESYDPGQELSKLLREDFGGPDGDPNK